jgi:hypothetical protein
MKTNRRFAWIAWAAVAAAAGFAPASFGSFSDRPDSGEPPMGVAFQSDAQGTKLNGVVSIELLDVQVTGTTRTAEGGARAVLRLRKGGEGPRGFSAALAGPIDISSADAITQLQIAVLAVFRDQILSGAIGFFGDECGLAGTACPAVVITPKRIDEAVVVSTFDGSDALYFVSDVELAVK